MINWYVRASILLWKTPQGDTTRQKAVFDLQPTNHELDIQATGKCKVWIREVTLNAQVKQARTEAHRIDKDSHISPANHATLSQVSVATRICVHTPDGKCAGMLRTKLYMSLANFERLPPCMRFRLLQSRHASTQRPEF